MPVNRLVTATVATALGGALVLGLAACGSSNNSGTAAPSSRQQPPNPARRGGPAASGTVAEVTAANIEVQNSSGQVTVNFSGATTFTDRVSATLVDVTQGSCVVVTGTGQPMLARNVEISTATANGCTGGFGGGAQPRNGTGQRPPSGSRAPRPSGANGARPAAGKVTAMTGNGFTVQEDNQQTGATTDVQVTVDANTTYAKSVSADSGALKVGECVAATGQTDDTGAVTARTIAISQPGPNGCGAGGRQRTNNGGNGNG
ncbi:DUF5666 domain-containing protein [Amycolatopsis taiwanensis]|uniref:DUF5666 domain-containing protein n=1 Tax=Amycolatopsis taiwanensis TaxID=342230 RepID=UPI000481F193|nr:DUF5666 domain-containing protein [Amycolatopsis taiwanensis]